MTKATVYYNGLVVWQPPAVYKSSCAIDVEFFPYDVQTCVLKLGSWTYDGFKVRVVFLLTDVCLELRSLYIRTVYTWERYKIVTDGLTGVVVCAVLVHVDAGEKKTTRIHCILLTI